MRMPAVIALSFLFAATLSGQTPTPSPIREEVIVVADRSASTIGETPASVTVLSKREIQHSAAPTLDETLRQSVGFSTFRRNGSRTSKQTTQDASLRGTGSGGAGRAAVLFDGVPLGDPFGG